MDKKRLMVLLDEYCSKENRNADEIVDFILETLGYAWQDGQEPDVIAMLKSAIA